MYTLLETFSDILIVRHSTVNIGNLYNLQPLSRQKARNCARNKRNIPDIQTFICTLVKVDADPSTIFTGKLEAEYWAIRIEARV